MYMTIKERTEDYYVINLKDKDTDYLFGEIVISIFSDHYAISGEVNHFEIDADIKLFDTRIKKLCYIFEELKWRFLDGSLGLPLDRPVYIVSDELISRDYIKLSNLRKVPRYCGYYFI